MKNIVPNDTRTLLPPATGSLPLAALLLVAACASGGRPAERDRSIEEYAPLAVGAKWTYAAKYPGQEGEIVVSMVRRDGEYFLDDRDGSFLHTPDGLRDKERFLIRYPLVPGNKWKAVVGPSAVEHMEIVSVGEPCEAEAGKFADCLVVAGQIRRDERMSLKIRWTWARGVGLAKLETAAEIKGQGELPQVTQSLRHYDLGAGDSSAGGSKAPEPAGSEDEGAPDSWESE